MQARPISGIGKARWTGVASGALFASMVASFLAQAWLLAGVLTVLFLAVLAWTIVQLRRKDPVTRKARESYQQLDVDEPSQWYVKNVLDRIREHEREIQVAEQAVRQNDRIELLNDQVNKREQLAEKARAGFTKVVKAAGLREATTEVGLVHLAHSIHDWQGGHTRLSTEREKLQNRRDRYAVTLTEMNEALALFGFDPVETADQGDVELGELIRRAEAHKKACSKLEIAQHDEERAKKDQNDTMEAHAEFLEKLELSVERDQSVDVRRSIRAALEHLATYKTLTERRTELNAALKVLEQQLTNHPELLKDDEAGLREQLAEAVQQQERLDEHNREIGGIQNAIGEAKRAHSLEEALAKRDTKIDEIDRDTAAKRRQRIGHLLVQRLKERSQRENLPQVFRRADELFRQVTNGEFELDWEPGERVLSARDTNSGRVRSLDELSDGTRLQLHVCVRIAFLEQQERGLALPLLLDELLANSDDARAEHLVDALVSVQKNSGRQIFYLTAQWDEVRKWQRIAEKLGMEEPAIHYMREATLAAQTPITHVLDTSVPEPAPDIPDPEGISHKEFGQQLSVPAFNPHAEITSLHIWYLIDDVPLIAHLLRQRVTSWGQLKTLCRNVPIAGIADDQWDRMELLAKLLSRAQRLWLLGRGRPVTAEDLKNGGITPRYLNDVFDVAKECLWNAEAILERLPAVDGIGPGRVEKLRQSFLDTGCLDEQDPLLSDDLHIELLRLSDSDISEGRLRLEDLEFVSALFSKSVADTK